MIADLRARWVLNSTASQARRKVDLVRREHLGTTVASLPGIQQAQVKEPRVDLSN